jgi:DNA-directed RNA polymerase specialized sigma24 family protein
MNEDELWKLARQVLTDKQFDALFMRYRLDLTSRTIAAHLGVSRQNVDQLLDRARERLANARKAAT